MNIIIVGIFGVDVMGITDGIDGTSSRSRGGSRSDCMNDNFFECIRCCRLLGGIIYFIRQCRSRSS